MRTKTRLMTALEEEHGLPLEELLRRSYELGRNDEQVAALLGISRLTLMIWLERLRGEKFTSVRFEQDRQSVG